MGRALAFDREQVLSRVTELFWLKGYQATSVADLVQQTRLNPGSLYNTFQSKHQLLLECIECYGRRRVHWVRSILEQHRPLNQLLRQLLQGIVDLSCDDPDAKGCFLLNIKLELGADDPQVQALFELICKQIEHAIAEAVGRAIKCDQVKPDTDATVLAKYLVMSIWGLRVLGRDRTNRVMMEAMVEQIMIPFQYAALPRLEPA
jgi:TetR/AcrR family transcriptional repressor of nem operon